MVRIEVPEQDLALILVHSLALALESPLNSSGVGETSSDSSVPLPESGVTVGVYADTNWSTHFGGLPGAALLAPIVPWRKTNWTWGDSWLMNLNVLTTHTLWWRQHRSHHWTQLCRVHGKAWTTSNWLLSLLGETKKNPLSNLVLANVLVCWSCC